MNILEYENYQEKISHGNPLFPYITYLCSIPLDFSYVPIHWHDEMEIIYIKKGHGIITVDFTQYQVSAGTLALIIPGQLHSVILAVLFWLCLFCLSKGMNDPFMYFRF